MDLKRFPILGIRFLAINAYRRSNRIITSSISSRVCKRRFCMIPVFSTCLTLSFLWPIRKSEKKRLKSEPEVGPLTKADLLFEKGLYNECYSLLTNQEVVKDLPEVEVQWRVCRVLYNMSRDVTDKEEQKNLIFKAYQIIYEQLQKYTDHFAVHKWYALLLDAKSSFVGIKERVRQLENVKKHMDLAVTINPKDATTLHMLGEWCFQVTELPWYHRKIAEVLFTSPPVSTYEDALEYFLRAEEAQPRFYGLNLLRIGICYLKLHKEDQAKYYLKLAAVYPAKTNDDHVANKEAAELLKKLM